MDVDVDIECSRFARCARSQCALSVARACVVRARIARARVARARWCALEFECSLASACARSGLSLVRKMVNDARS